MKPKLWQMVGLITAFSIGVAGCSQPAQAPASDASTQTTATAPESGNYPVEVKSCEDTLTFEKAPERVFIFSETNAAILYELGVIDHVKFRAGAEKLTDDQKEMKDAIEKIEKIESPELSSGGATLTTEAILDVNPDLVIAYDSGVDREGLQAAGVAYYSPDAWCAKKPTEKADWSLVDKEIDKMAAIFGVPERAEEVKKAQAEKIASLAGGEAQADAAALYITPGSAEFYAYGKTSMVQPIFEANALRNVYEDETQLVFDVSMEDLLKRNPEWIVLLATDGDGEAAAKETFLSFSGASGLQAVEKDQVVFVPFVLVEPPSTLSVEGAIELGKLVK